MKDSDLSYLHHQRLCIVTCLFKLCGPHSKPTVGVRGVPKEMIACFMCVAVTMTECPLRIVCVCRFVSAKVCIITRSY